MDDGVRVERELNAVVSKDRECSELLVLSSQAGPLAAAAAAAASKPALQWCTCFAAAVAAAVVAICACIALCGCLPTLSFVLPPPLPGAAARATATATTTTTPMRAFRFLLSWLRYWRCRPKSITTTAAVANAARLLIHCAVSLASPFSLSIFCSPILSLA